jgi:hypothetical protein
MKFQSLLNGYTTSSSSELSQHSAINVRVGRRAVAIDDTTGEGALDARLSTTPPVLDGVKFLRADTHRGWIIARWARFS